MQLSISQGALLLLEGDTLVTCIPCPDAKELGMATVLLMCTLKAHAVKQLTVIGACIWPVTKREDLHELLIPYFN